MYKLEIGKIMHKISNNLSCHISKLLVITDKIHSHNTKQNTKKNYFLPRVHTSQAQKLLTTVMYSYRMKSQNQLKMKYRIKSFIKIPKNKKLICFSRYTEPH